MKKIGVILLIFCLFAVCSACKSGEKDKTEGGNQTASYPEGIDVIEAPDSEDDLPILDFETGEIIENSSGSSEANGGSSAENGGYFAEAGSSPSDGTGSSAQDPSVSSDGNAKTGTSSASSGSESAVSSSNEGMSGWEPFS